MVGRTLPLTDDASALSLSVWVEVLVKLLSDSGTGCSADVLWLASASLLLAVVEAPWLWLTTIELSLLIRVRLFKRVGDALGVA